MCPICGKVVEDKYGICHMCGSNVMQCRSCRNINYEKPDTFFCNLCGISKYCEYKISYDVRKSTESAQVTDEKSKK